jgi:hypothetical protein
MIAFLLTLLVTSSFADNFSQHTVPVEPITCKPLNYDTYFVAQNSKANIVESNPSVSKPNFAGHYLLLKNPLMMEVVWLIADCSTGKFLKEKLSGPKLEFKTDSALVVLGFERSPSETYVWTDENWNRIEVVSTDENSPTKSTAEPAMQKTTDQQYGALFEKNRVSVTANRCKPIDFNSYFKAQKAKENILSFKPDLSTANFAGHYLLLKNELMFQNLWLIADCETGKFLPVSVIGKALFRADSALVVMRQSGDFNQLMLWSDLQWIELVDSSRTKHPSVNTTLEGEKAKMVLNALPNPERLQKIKFENLACHDQTCTVDLPKRPKTTLKPGSSAALNALLQILGGPLESGFCEVRGKFTSCEITIR